MCGITGYYAKESVPDISVFDILFTQAEKRGSDAFGFTISNSDGVIFKWKKDEPYSKNKEIVLFHVENHMDIGCLLLANSRLEPETETQTIDAETDAQPIVRDGCVLVHNGSINRFDHERIMKDVDNVSNLDSEAIIVSYIQNKKNIIKTMKSMGGGIAALMHDIESNQVIVMQTHNPLSHGYFRGVGMFWHSRQEALDEVRECIVKANSDGCCMWENYYAHPKTTPFRCTRIDLDSGFMGADMKFEPNYSSHPTWNQSEENDDTLYLVGASSGIDSTTNLAILKEIGANVMAVHVKYGHRGEEAEELALKNICEVLDVPMMIIDQNAYYKTVDNFSMLTNENQPITTGGNKTISAWVTGRNVNILRILCDISESNILQNKCSKAVMCLGFNISEESVYPDNSQLFVESFMKMAKLGYLSGTRMKFCNITQNLNKTEMMLLLDKLDLYNKLIPLTISCDRPKVIDGKPRNCSVVRDGKSVPGCGSGWLYSRAAENSGLQDIKYYYDVDDPGYQYRNKPSSKTRNTGKDIMKIIDSLNIEEEGKVTLSNKLKKG